MSINYSIENGLSIKVNQEALAFDDGLWTENYEPCTATMYVFNNTGPQPKSVPGIEASCVFQWASNCNSISCSVYIGPPIR